MDRETKAKEILAKVPYAVIATASKTGQPWNSPVLVAYDEKFNFYWVSWHGTQHSQHIRENPEVFFVVFDSSVPLGSGECVYIKARAEELSDPAEIHRGSELRYARKNEPPKDSSEFLGSSLRRMYKAVPEKVWITTDDEAKADITVSRQEVALI